MSLLAAVRHIIAMIAFLATLFVGLALVLDMGSLDSRSSRLRDDFHDIHRTISVGSAGFGCRLLSNEPWLPRA
jgi:hypothetical protein